MPPRIFDSLVSTRRGASQLTPDPTARVAEINARDLTEIASRAQQRQQAILEANPGDGSLFPVQEVNGALPNLLSTTNPGQVNSPQQSSSVDRTARAGSDGSVSPVSESGQSQVGAPQQPAPRLSEASFEQLTPTQRLEAYGSVFAQRVDAVVGEDGSFQTSESGSPIVAFQPRNSEAVITVAQEVVPASAMFAEAMRRLRVQAQPTSSGEKTVTYAGDEGSVVALARKFGAKIARSAEGGIDVQFDSTHPLNTRFHEAPFAEPEVNEDGPSDPRLRRFVR